MKLKINDKIYQYNAYDIIVHKIIRTTKTLAITDTQEKFKIDADQNGYCVKLKEPTFSCSPKFYYQVENRMLRELFEKNKITKILEKIDFKKLDLKTLQIINEVIK